ncbi:hypothetical protein GCM10009853_069940 [Glycomyces scopariae]
MPCPEAVRGTVGHPSDSHGEEGIQEPPECPRCFPGSGPSGAGRDYDSGAAKIGAEKAFTNFSSGSTRARSCTKSSIRG